MFIRYETYAEVSVKIEEISSMSISFV